MTVSQTQKEKDEQRIAILKSKPSRVPSIILPLIVGAGLFGLGLGPFGLGVGAAIGLGAAAWVVALIIVETVRAIRFSRYAKASGYSSYEMLAGLDESELEQLLQNQKRIEVPNAPSQIPQQPIKEGLIQSLGEIDKQVQNMDPELLEGFKPVITNESQPQQDTNVDNPSNKTLVPEVKKM